jgi:hypothetical protein
VVRASLRNLLQQHPLLVAWSILAVGMVAMLLYAAKDVALLPSQLAALVVATVLLAGACVWILTWE